MRWGGPSDSYAAVGSVMSKKKRSGLRISLTQRETDYSTDIGVGIVILDDGLVVKIII